MKKIGLLGGMSWESTALYYELINELVRDRLGGLHSARAMLGSVDFADIEELQRTGRWDLAGEHLAREASLLEAAGADFLVLCTNTMHKVVPRIEEDIAIPVLHLADVTAEAVLRAGIRRIGFLGTGFSMDDPFLTDRLVAHGLSVVLPEEDDRCVVHRVIYDELVRGIVLDGSRDEYRRIIADLVARGAEGVILGCTEIELLVSQEDSAVPVFPTTRLHAEAAVEKALSR